MNFLRILMLAVSISLLSCGGKTNSPQPSGGSGTGTTAPVATKDYTFGSTPSWADEFNDGTKPDTSKWGAETGGNGWGNHELEYYTNGDNVSIVNGNLVITAKKENIQTNNYTSARLYSKGTGNFTYGRFEIRAKIPGGTGTWPAIWMLPTDYSYGAWPNSGEIDIMEHVGYDPNNIHFTVHTGLYNGMLGTQKGTTVNVPTALTDFHVYRIDWTPTGITAYIDGQQIYIYKNDQTGYMSWPFDKRFHMMLNLAVGGDWGGIKGVDDTAFPAAMQIDYVRVYKINNL